MWRALVEPGVHILEDAGPRASWAPRTQDKKIQSYGYWLNFVSLRFPELLALAPCARIKASIVAAWLDLMSTLVSSYTRLMRVVDLMTIATGAAPGCDWGFLRRLVARLDHVAVPSKDKATRVRSTAALLDIGMRLMQEAVSVSADPYRQREIRYRDGLMIAFLALRPMRLRNLAGLELSVTLLEIDGRHHIVFPAEQVKNRKPLEIDWPVELEPALRDYLEVYRSRLLGARASSFLWIKANGAPLLEAGIFVAITGRTKAGLGVSINPHLFRDCAATTVACEDPAHVGISTCLLGHASTATTDKFYNQASSLSASRVYQEMLTRQRIVLRPSTTPPSRASRLPSIQGKVIPRQNQLSLPLE
jgi:integrase/recombinase XerD